MMIQRILSLLRDVDFAGNTVGINMPMVVLPSSDVEVLSPMSGDVLKFVAKPLDCDVVKCRTEFVVVSPRWVGVKVRPPLCQRVVVSTVLVVVFGRVVGLGVVVVVVVVVVDVVVVVVVVDVVVVHITSMRGLFEHLSLLNAVIFPMMLSEYRQFCGLEYKLL